MIDLLSILNTPGYIEHIETKSLKIEISKEEILELIREGKIRVRADGYVEIIEHPIKNVTPRLR